MQKTVREIREQLRQELEVVMSNLPPDETVVDFNEANENQRSQNASLLQDVTTVVPLLLVYYTQEEVTKIMGENKVLAMLLSRWTYRIDFISQRFVR